MLSLHTTEAFESWFAALADAAAEDVATAVDLVQALGPERCPPQSSDLVLWYQSAEGADFTDRFFDSELYQFATRSRRALAHLQTPAVQRRLARLSGREALYAEVMLERFAALARRWRRGFGEPAAGAELDATYGAMLELLGLPAPSEVPTPVLRELQIRERRLRVLYGVDPASERALMILGEALDRQAYGPSVRRALALWSEFLLEDCSPRLQAGSGC